MKNLLVIIIVLTSLQVIAQSVTIPAKEFSTSLSKDRVELKSTDEQKLEIFILKSKSYQKSKVQMGLSSSLPKGVIVSFSPQEGNFETCEVSITTNQAAPGEYTLIINATVNNKRKGSIVKLFVQ